MRALNNRSVVAESARQRGRFMIGVILQGGSAGAPGSSAFRTRPSGSPLPRPTAVSSIARLRWLRRSARMTECRVRVIRLQLRSARSVAVFYGMPDHGVNIHALICPARCVSRYRVSRLRAVGHT